MSTMHIVFTTICLHYAVRISLATWPWTIGSPDLPRSPVYGTSAGIWNDTVLIMGGNGAEGVKVMEFDTKTWTSTDISSSHPLSKQSYCRGQCYTQRDEILYMAQMSGGNIVTYNLITKESITGAITPPFTVSLYATICASEDYLFLFDGKSTGNYNWTAFRFSNSTFIGDLPPLQKKRGSAACIVSHDRLFMFGGYFYVQYSSTNWHDTNEEISATNFASDSWNFTTPLALRLSMVRLAAYEDLIFITGGFTTSNQYNTQKSFQIMNITSNTITVSPFNLPYGLIEHSVILQFPFLYLFGGYKSGSQGVATFNSWLYIDLLATAHPTSSPTAAPTKEPTQPTSAPSEAPTMAHCGTQTEIYYDDGSQLMDNWQVSDYNGWYFDTEPADGDNYCYFETCFGLTHEWYYGYIHPYYDQPPGASLVYVRQNTAIDVSGYTGIKLKFALAGGPQPWSSNNGGSRCTLQYALNGGSSWVTAKYITIGSLVTPQKYTTSVGNTVSSIRLKLELRQQNYESFDSCYLDEISVCGTVKTTTGAPTTSEPTESPSLFPTIPPTKLPTKSPTKAPSLFPTRNPSVSPTKSPTKMPSFDPTNGPTNEPTFVPTSDPTLDPTYIPTADPTYVPTVDPTEFISTDDEEGENDANNKGETIFSNTTDSQSLMIMVLIAMASLLWIATMYFVIRWWKEKRNKTRTDLKHMDPQTDVVHGGDIEMRSNENVNDVNEVNKEVAEAEMAAPEGPTATTAGAQIADDV